MFLFKLISCFFTLKCFTSFFTALGDTILNRNDDSGYPFLCVILPRLLVNFTMHIFSGVFDYFVGCLENNFYVLAQLGLFEQISQKFRTWTKRIHLGS